MEKRNNSPTTTNTGKGPHRRLHHLSPALVIASIALFVSLGGVGYAAATGSIDSREIKNNNVRGKDIRTATLGGSDVKNNALRGADVLESSLGTVPQATNAAHANTATAASSAANAAHLGGIPASSYPSGVEIVTAESPVVTADPAAYGVGNATATCPAGKKVIGGGGSSNFINLQVLGVLNVAVQDSVPNATQTGWRVSSIESGDPDEEGQPWTTTAFAICAAR